MAGGAKAPQGRRGQGLTLEVEAPRSDARGPPNASAIPRYVAHLAHACTTYNPHARTQRRHASGAAGAAPSGP